MTEEKAAELAAALTIENVRYKTAVQMLNEKLERDLKRVYAQHLATMYMSKRIGPVLGLAAWCVAFFLGQAWRQMS